jgi:hypothetical protein
MLKEHRRKAREKKQGGINICTVIFTKTATTNIRKTGRPLTNKSLKIKPPPSVYAQNYAARSIKWSKSSP